jgi:hypothetical protein
MDRQRDSMLDTRFINVSELFRLADEQRRQNAERRRARWRTVGIVVLSIVVVGFVWWCACTGGIG